MQRQLRYATRILQLADVRLISEFDRSASLAVSCNLCSKAAELLFRVHLSLRNNYSDVEGSTLCDLIEAERAVGEDNEFIKTLLQHADELVSWQTVYYDNRLSDFEVDFLVPSLIHKLLTRFASDLTIEVKQLYTKYEKIFNSLSESDRKDAEDTYPELYKLWESGDMESINEVLAPIS